MLTTLTPRATSASSVYHSHHQHTYKYLQPPLALCSHLQAATTARTHTQPEHYQLTPPLAAALGYSQLIRKYCSCLHCPAWIATASALMPSGPASLSMQPQTQSLRESTAATQQLLRPFTSHTHQHTYKYPQPLHSYHLHCTAICRQQSQHPHTTQASPISSTTAGCIGLLTSDVQVL